MKRISRGLFKNRIRKARSAHKESTPDYGALVPTVSGDDLSDSSPVPGAEGKVALHTVDPRWSVVAERNINELDNDDDEETTLSLWKGCPILAMSNKVLRRAICPDWPTDKGGRRQKAQG